MRLACGLQVDSRVLQRCVKSPLFLPLSMGDAWLSWAAVPRFLCGGEQGSGAGASCGLVGARPEGVRPGSGASGALVPPVRGWHSRLAACGLGGGAWPRPVADVGFPTAQWSHSGCLHGSRGRQHAGTRPDSPPPSLRRQTAVFPLCPVSRRAGPGPPQVLQGFTRVEALEGTSMGVIIGDQPSPPLLYGGLCFPALPWPPGALRAGETTHQRACRRRWPHPTQQLGKAQGCSPPHPSAQATSCLRLRGK